MLRLLFDQRRELIFSNLQLVLLNRPLDFTDHQIAAHFPFAFLNEITNFLQLRMVGLQFLDL